MARNASRSPTTRTRSTSTPCTRSASRLATSSYTLEFLDLPLPIRSRFRGKLPRQKILFLPEIFLAHARFDERLKGVEWHLMCLLEVLHLLRSESRVNGWRRAVPPPG